MRITSLISIGTMSRPRRPNVRYDTRKDPFLVIKSNAAALIFDLAIMMIRQEKPKFLALLLRKTLTII